MLWILLIQGETIMGKNKTTVIPQQNKQIVHREEIRHYSYSWILPPPEMLNQYNAIEAGLANRIVKMAEKQQEHRFGLEKEWQRKMFLRDARIQYISGTIVLVIIIWGFFLLAIGRNVEGYLTLWATAITTIGSWFFSREHNEPQKTKDTNK